MPAKRQTLLFSATFNDEVRPSPPNSSDPSWWSCARNSVADNLTRSSTRWIRRAKADLLVHLIKRDNMGQDAGFCP